MKIKGNKTTKNFSNLDFVNNNNDHNEQKNNTIK
jgi:hypothetical protein